MSPEDFAEQSEIPPRHANGARPKRPNRPTEQPGIDLAARHVTASAEWYATMPKPREYLLIDSRTADRGALAARGVALLVGAGGSSKSYATLALAHAIASGGTWLGTFRVARPGRVLVITDEDDADEVRRRLFYIAAGKPPEHEIDVLDLHDVHAPMLTAEGRASAEAEAIIAHIRERGPYVLVIVDPLARCSGASIDVTTPQRGRSLPC